MRTRERIDASQLDLRDTVVAINRVTKVVAGGVESMSRAPFVMLKAENGFARTASMADSTIGWRFINPRMKALHGVESMAETAEIVAQQHGVLYEQIRAGARGTAVGT